MKNYTIYVNGTPYNVSVEEGGAAPAAPVAEPVAPAAPVVEEAAPVAEAADEIVIEPANPEE